MNLGVQSPPPADPFGSASGAALDVIVVVPSSSSSSSPLRRSSSHYSTDQSQRHESSSPAAANNDLSPPLRGVVASSDFFVTFPSGMAWSQQSSPKKSISGKSSTRSIRSMFYSSSSSTLSDASNSGGDRKKSSGSISSVIEEEGVEVGVDGGVDLNTNARSTLSERGTSCTEPHVNRSQPRTEPISQRQIIFPSTQQMQGGKNIQQQQTQLSKGNVQIQINGRYMPQLDMLFSRKRGYTSSRFLGSSTVGSSNGDEPSCRFVNGNGLRPPTETLNMLIDNKADDIINDMHDETTDQSCACNESIQNSEHHFRATGPNKDPSGPQRIRQGAILNYGRNLIRYTLFSKKGMIEATAESHLYLWKSSDSVVISDVDGTVTKSDVRGVIDTVIQDRFEYCHEGICKFYHDMVVGGQGGIDGNCREACDNDSPKQALTAHQPMDKGSATGEIRFVYLSSRPISLIGQTRKLLVSLSQMSLSNQRYGLPPGPIFHHRGPLSSVLYSELVAKNIHEFKADVLARQVVLPFVAAKGEDWRTPVSRRRDIKHRRCGNGGSEPSGNNEEDSTSDIDADIFKGRNENGNYDRSQSLGGISEASSVWDDRLFLAGFGNKLTDAMAYEMAGVDRRDIYIIDKESRILCMGHSADEIVDNCFGPGASFSSEPPNESITKDRTKSGALGDQSGDWSVPEICCPGGVAEGGQISPELLPLPVNAKTASALNANRIHSIELSLSGERQQDESLDDLAALEGLAVSKTSVDIYVTNDRTKGGSNTSVKRSKRSKVKQSIRAFSSKKSFAKYPSFGVSSSARKTSSKKMYEGYGDHLLLARVVERMIS